VVGKVALKRRSCFMHAILVANAAAERFCSCAHSRITSRALHGGSKAFDSELASRDRVRPDALSCHAPAPKRLVGEEGHDHGREAGAKPGVCGASATVVHYGSELWEQPVVRNLVDDEEVVITQI